MVSSKEQETLNTYNRIAVGWTASLRDDFWHDEYNKFSGYLPKGKILDVGCGSGRDSLWFTEHGYDYLGIDASEEMLSLAKVKNPKAKFLLKSYYDLDFLPLTFDGFWAAYSILHVARQNINKVLAKLKGILKPGAIGFISIKEGNGERSIEWQTSGQKRHFIYYGQEEFAEILKSAGFEILEMSKRPPNGERQGSTFLIYYIKVV